MKENENRAGTTLKILGDLKLSYFTVLLVIQCERRLFAFSKNTTQISQKLFQYFIALAQSSFAQTVIIWCLSSSVH